MSLTAIIVASGSSRRMGFDKLLAELNGKPVLQHSIEAFINCDDVTEVIVVCPMDRFSKLNLDSSKKRVTRIDGGKDRHDSVAAGLASLSSQTKYVAVHDGARPLISLTQTSKVYQAAQEHQSAASARPVTETVKRANDAGIVTESVSRENLWLMETPQIFSAQLLLEAYNEVAKNSSLVTDEVSAMELIGHSTFLVANDTTNIKITYPQDITQAELSLGL